MSVQRDRAEEQLLLRLAARYIAREANRNTLITPTRVSLSSARTRATVYVSVFPDTAADKAVEFLQRHRGDFFDFLKKESRLHPLPGVHFEFDVGEQNRQRLDELSQEIDSGEVSVPKDEEESL